MFEVSYPPQNPHSPVLLQGFPLVFADTWISRSYRAAANRNQWMMHGITSAEFPSQYPAQQLTWEHTRPIPISEWLCSVTHLQDSPKIINIPTAEDRIHPTIQNPVLCLLHAPQDVGTQLQESSPSQVRTYFQSQHSISPAREKVSLWVCGCEWILCLEQHIQGPRDDHFRAFNQVLMPQV